MIVGDTVTWDGKTGVITSIDRPKCKCKGKGFYLIDVDGVTYKVPVSTELQVV